jgi:hypothetical protein
MDWEKNPSEEGWLQAQNPGLMLRYVRRMSSARRLRLVSVACCRAAWPFLPTYSNWVSILGEPNDAECHAVLDLAERFADGAAKYGELMATRRALAGPDVPRGGPQHPKVAAVWFASAKDPAPACTECAARLLGISWGGSGELEMPATRVRFGFGGDTGDWPAACLAMVAVIRDIFGNPFQLVEFEQGWRSDTVRALARDMYLGGDFAALPILADALQDAGCHSEDILNHCHSTERHVRGCWVVDLVLDKR